jgi:catecholate siderophore receptor
MLTTKPHLASALAAASLILLAAARSASAQDAPARDSTKADSAAAGQEKNAQMLEAIRVNARRSASSYSSDVTRTGTKIPALPRDIPQSLTTVTSALVRDQAMKSMADVVRYIPGITMGQGEGNRDQPTIRGNGTTADFFIDGVRDDAQYFRDLYNLERVEALKGSNAMVFGRGGGGGVLNRVTKEARGLTGREVLIEGGSFGAQRISTDLQQKVSSIFAARLNSVYENSESFRDNVSIDRSGINPTVALSNAANTTRLSAGYEYFRDRRTADRGIPSFEGKPVDTDPSTFFGSADRSVSRIEVSSANATISHEGQGFHVRNRSTFADYDKYYQNIYPSGATASEASIVGYNHGIGRRNFFNQTDLLLSRKFGAVSNDLVVGAEVGVQSTESIRNTAYFGGTNTTVRVPLNDPAYLGEVAFRQSASDADNGTDVTTRSLYVQDQVTLSPAIRLIGGVRYENFALRFEDKRTDDVRKRTDGMFSPRLGVVLKPVQTASLYASYSRSYLPGSGDQFGSLTEITKALEPERFTNYEIGAKWDAHDRLSLTLAAYRLDRTNTRSVDPTDASRVIQTGAQRSQGLELGASGSVTDKWEIAAGAAAQSAKIIHATASSRAGAKVALVPSKSVSLWNKYSLTPRFALAAGAVYQSKMFAAVDNTVTLPGFTRFDGGLYVGITRGLRAQINVENIFDTKYYPTSNGNNNIAPGSPREARLSLSASF